MTNRPRRAMTCAYMPDGATFNGQRNSLPKDYFDSLKVRFIADDTVRLTELRSGNVHIIDNIQAKDVPVASKDPALDNVENTYQKSCYQFTFSVKSPKFADLKLRQAVHYAVDRNAIAKAVKSLTTSSVSKPSARRVASIEKLQS